MDIKRLGDGDVIDIDGKFRIEKGPLRKKAIATKELLDDEVTAAHYKVGAPDSLGKPIVLGQEMNYIDWKNRRTEFTFTVYQLKDVEQVDKDGKKTIVKRFMPLGNYPDEMAALSYVTGLK